MERLNRTRAFLTEFIIVILFFSVAAVITIQLYMKADNVADNNAEVSVATLYGQSVAENIRARTVYYDNYGIFSEYLDGNMMSVLEAEAVYQKKIIVSLIEDESSEYGEMIRYNIVISKAYDGSELYSLEFKQYVCKEVQR